MVNVFGDSIASGIEGNLQVAKKVVTTVDQYRDYDAEIQHGTAWYICYPHSYL